MSYLLSSDYKRLITDLNVQQLISGDNQKKTLAENAALEEVKSFLNKYDLSVEFADIAQYSPALTTYKAMNRLYVDGPAYSATATYAVGALTLYLGNVYVCSTAIGVAEPFTLAHWTLLGIQYEMFYAQYPKPLFDLEKGIYKKDDQVFWADHTYKCIVPTGSFSQTQLIQYKSTNDIPFLNMYPDDPVDGAKFWEDLGAYNIPAGKILDTTYFTRGDNRNQQLVMYVLDVVIYHLYRSITPQVVPQLRIASYQAAISWLRLASKPEGDIIPNLPKLQPRNRKFLQADSFRWGSMVKNQNYY